MDRAPGIVYDGIYFVRVLNNFLAELVQSVSFGILLSIPTKLHSYENLLSDVSSLLTVPPNEGQSPEGYNMAMGGASCTHTRPPTRWPPCWRSWPPAPGGPQGKGVLRQVVQHVLLALFLGPWAAGQRSSFPFDLVRLCFTSRHLTRHSHACRWSSVGAQLSGDVPQLPEEDRHGRAATCRFWRGGRRWQEHKEEKQRPPFCPHGGGVLSFWSQVWMVDDPPHAQPQVWETHAVELMSLNSKGPFRFRANFALGFGFCWQRWQKEQCSLFN